MEYYNNPFTKLLKDNKNFAYKNLVKSPKRTKYAWKVVLLHFVIKVNIVFSFPNNKKNPYIACENIRQNA